MRASGYSRVAGQGLALLLAALPATAAGQPASQPASLPTSQRAAAPTTAPAQPAPAPDRARLLERIDALERRQREQDEQLEEVRLDALARDQEEPREPKLRLFGFFDVNFQKWTIPGEAVFEDVVGEQPAFIFGNFNLYVDARPHRDWRMLGEVRFTLDPLANVESYEVQGTDTEFRRKATETADAAGFMDHYQLAGLSIERAWVEWRRLQWLNVTLGLFLTPYGIWNIDHGSPTRLQATYPLMYLGWASYFPERQLGLKLHGSTTMGDTRLAYALTVSNGRGEFADLRDPDWDKAVGGRLEASGMGPWKWQLGLSFYVGHYSANKQVITLAPVLDLHEEVTIRFLETALGADLKLEHGPWTLQAEVMANWRNYDDDHRAPADIWDMVPAFQDALAGGSTLASDKVAFGSYGVLAYRLPIRVVNLRPFFSVLFNSFTDNVAHENLVGTSVGVNWRIRGEVVIKVEHLIYFWPNPRPPDQIFAGTDAVHLTASQLAVAF